MKKQNLNAVRNFRKSLISNAKAYIQESVAARNYLVRPENKKLFFGFLKRNKD